MAAGVQHGTATQFPGLSTAGSHHSNVHVRVIPNVFNNYRNQQIKRRNYHLKRGVIPGGGSRATSRHSSDWPYLDSAGLSLVLTATGRLTDRILHANLLCVVVLRRETCEGDVVIADGTLSYCRRCRPVCRRLWQDRSKCS